MYQCPIGRQLHIFICNEAIEIVLGEFLFLWVGKTVVPRVV